jgi:NAD(P)-dependent dehydrogenase (short-subunit alcohol dehydrogenase family)
MSVAGKTALVTGAARGLGFAYAKSLRQAGVHVVVGDVADCTAAAEAAGNGAFAVTLDVTDVASCVSMGERAMERFGRIDALIINNATLYGSLRGGRFDQIPEPAWNAAMAINVRGIWTAARPWFQRCDNQAVARSSISRRLPRPTGCRLRFTTRHRRRRSSD